MGGTADARRALPAVHRVLAEPALAGLVDVPAAPPSAADLAAQARARVLAARTPPLRRVVNATGVVLHTNLGRAVLAEAAVRAATEAAAHYTNLEYDLARGERGDRGGAVEDIVRDLTGAQAAAVVNNNAAAVFLFLLALAQGREVVVSRGELVEIGGSFRVPDVMAASGARLVEVGTTNRTHLRDYAAAIGPETAVLLKAHPSNFRVRGFTAEVAPGELAALGRERGVVSAMDLGSGLMQPVAGVDEPVVGDLVASGLDVVLFSGDKLLGGPQAGIAVGRRDVIAAMRSHPLARALRVDKMTLAALAATLALYRDGLGAQVPAVAMLSRPPAELGRAARQLAGRLRRALGPHAAVTTAPGASEAGGGSAPDQALATTLVRVRSPLGATALARRLRAGEPAVVVRVADDAVVIDPRTLSRDDARILVGRLTVALVAETAGRDV